MSRHPPEPDNFEDHGEPQREFHPWRLLGVITGVMVVLAVIAAAVDIIVLGF